MAQAMFYVEKECHTGPILSDYPAMKFFSQVECLSEHMDKEKQEMDRTKRG